MSAPDSKNTPESRIVFPTLLNIEFMQYGKANFTFHFPHMTPFPTHISHMNLFDRFLDCNYFPTGTPTISLRIRRSDAEVNPRPSPTFRSQPRIDASITPYSVWLCWFKWLTRRISPNSS